MATPRFANFARTTLTAAAPAGTLVPTLTVGSTAAFPAISGKEVFTLVLTDAGETAFEICMCFAKTATTFTVERGLEGTTVRSWPVGTKVENRLTAATLNALCDAVEV
jgi:hypothetical protein